MEQTRLSLRFSEIDEGARLTVRADKNGVSASQATAFLKRGIKDPGVLAAARKAVRQVLENPAIQRGVDFG